LYRSITDWAAEQLSGDEILLPVRMLWREAWAAGFVHRLTAEEFTALLEGDPRFEVVPAEEEMDEGLTPEDLALLEEAGFFSGPRVKLAERELTPEYLARKIEESTTNLLNALRDAWESLPPGADEEAFLEIWEMAQKLEAGMKEAVAEIRSHAKPKDEQG